MENQAAQFTNDLIHESSPYLLQHAHNPVDWKAWNDATLDKAARENKLILISVGYSACHWCHVMEHESFENTEVASVMNTNYICIKVDREERPDIDHVYMNAVQVMTGAGGWPMNVVALPDGRPVWGGTYFRKEHWMDALKQIAKLYEKQPEKLTEYADKLENGLKQIELIEASDKESELNREIYQGVLKKWKAGFDHKNGGYKRAPKFMMPNNYEFLLRYAFQNSDDKLMEFCLHTLDRISWGGVYDPVEGGFSRYSVDERWHVPHFEKMLYDNAQLTELYSKAYKITGNQWYKEVVDGTLKFIEKELTHPTGAFYSALDADSLNKKEENVEGAYYVWTKDELENLLGKDFNLFSKVFNINNSGLWEAGNYVLIRTKNRVLLAEELEISEKDLKSRIEAWMNILQRERSKRPKPGLDDKALTSWNAMMISGYTEAYKAFKNEAYLNAAINNANFIINRQLQEDGRLFHSFKEGKSSINAYLEDYAFFIKALLDLYESTYDLKYLENTGKFLEIVEEDFNDPVSGMYFFTSAKDRPLITKTIEIADNVIPASNSVMAKNFFRFGKLTGKQEYIGKAEKMLKNVQDKIPEYPQSYSNWLDLMMNFTHPHFEIAVTGKDHIKNAGFFMEKYLPNIVLAATNKKSELALLKDRLVSEKNFIYVCSGNTCQLPVSSGEDALPLIEQV
jgi:uncharacterized protein